MLGPLYAALHGFTGHMLEKSARGFIGTVGARVRPVDKREEEDRAQEVEKGVFELVPESDYRTLFRLFKNLPTVRACVDVIAKSATSRGFFFEPVTDDADPANRKILEDFFEEPNPEDTAYDLFMSVFTDLTIFGDDYWEIVRSEGRPIEIWPLDPIGTKILSDEHGGVKGYSNTTAQFPTVNFEADDVVHFRMGSMIVTEGGRMGRSLYGLSPLESIQLAAEQDLWALVHMKRFLQAGAKPRVAYVFADVTEMQAKRNEEYLIEANKPENAHRDMILRGRNVKIEKLGSSPQEQDLLGQRRFIRDEILAALGVPPSLVSFIETGNIGSGTGESQQENFRENTIIPLQDKVARRVTMSLIRRAFGIRDWRLRFYPPEIVSEKSQAEIDKIYLETLDSQGVSVRSAEEVRAERFDRKGLSKALSPKDISVRTGRTNVMVEITRDFAREIKRVLRKQVSQLVSAFTEEIKGVVQKAMTDALGDQQFKLQYTTSQWGVIEFKKYSWPQFLKQASELEAALNAISADEIGTVIADHFIALADESLKVVARQTKSEQMVLAAATREALLGSASELSKHVATTLSDAARTEIVQGIQEGESISELTRRLRTLDTTQVEVRPIGKTAHTRQRKFAQVAETIARTEGRRVFNEVGKAQMREVGIEEVRWLGEGDADEECAQFIGKIYKIGDVPGGGPPVHHGCRCALQPIIPTG